MTKIFVLGVCALQFVEFVQGGSNDIVSNTEAPADTASTSFGGMPVIQAVIAVLLSAMCLLIIFKVFQYFTRTQASAAQGNGLLPVSCAVCKVNQLVPRSGQIFICYQCHSANFVSEVNGGGMFSQLSPERSAKTVTLQRLTNTFFKEGPTAQSDQASPTLPQSIPPTNPQFNLSPSPLAHDAEEGAVGATGMTQCTVCMDANADTVLLPCAHGGICFNCADLLIRRSLLQGGAHCPQCRGEIHRLVKISEMHNDIARGVEIQIPRARILFSAAPQAIIR